MDESQVVMLQGLGGTIALFVGFWFMIQLLDGNKLTNKLLLALKQNLEVKLVRRKYFWQPNYLAGDLQGFPVKIFEYSPSNDSMAIAIRITLPRQTFRFYMKKKAKRNFTKSEILTGVDQVDQHYLFKSIDKGNVIPFLEHKEVLQILSDYGANFKVSDTIEIRRQYLYYFFPSTNITEKRKARFLKAVDFSLRLANYLTKYNHHSS